MAMNAAYLAAKRVYLNPESVAHGAESAARLTQYRYLWAQYQNSAYEDTAAWQRYVSDLGLYQFTRSIYNPFRRDVQIWVGLLYPGVLTPDGLPLPSGKPLAIPLSRDTDPALRLAIAQTWQWGWWLKNMRLAIRYAAATGNALVEAGDFPDKGKVAPVVYWPGHVLKFRLDEFGNLKRYTIEYEAEDDEGKRYTYRREVDDVRVRTFRDDQPFEYEGVPSDYEHGYGFAPAVWLKHRDEGSDVGAPAISSFGKIDELNSLVSHIHDQIHIEVDAPSVLWFKGSLGRVGQQSADAAANRERGAKLLLTGPEGGSKESLAGDLNLAATDSHIDRLLKEIEEDYPELRMWRELRSMSAVTGPGAERMLGDVESAIGEVAPGYDQQFIKLHQMLVAIGGHRANSGAWGSSLTDAQRKFLPFDLDSYRRGKLDHSIDPRPLVPQTDEEKWAGEIQRAEVAMKWAELSGSKVYGFSRAGITTEELETFFGENARLIEAERLLESSDLGPDNEEPPEL